MRHQHFKIKANNLQSINSDLCNSCSHFSECKRVAVHLIALKMHTSKTSRKMICLRHSLQLTFVSHSFISKPFHRVDFKRSCICFSKITTEYGTEVHVHIFFRLGNSSTSLSSLIEKTDKVIFNIEVNGESCDMASASPFRPVTSFPFVCIY